MTIHRKLCVLHILVCASGLANAQNTLLSVNFEEYAPGDLWSGKSAAKIIADPTSGQQGKVLQVTVNAGGNPSGITKKLALSKKVEQACLEYDIYFEHGFEFKKGKLPGLAGGNIPTGCVDAQNGFSNRYTWQADGRLTQYQYFPDKTARCGTHTTVGTLKTGTWQRLKSCIAMGTPGKADGSWQTWIDDSASPKRQIKWRESDNVGISHLLVHSFYSNSVPDKQVKVYFDNFRVYQNDSSISQVTSALPSAPSDLEVTKY